MGLQRVRQPTPVFFPGKSHGQGGLWQAIVHRVAKSRTWPHYWADNIVLQCSFDWYLFDINEIEGFLYAYWLIIFLFLKHPFYCLINFILLISDISHFFLFWFISNHFSPFIQCYIFCSSCITNTYPPEIYLSFNTADKIWLSFFALQVFCIFIPLNIAIILFKVSDFLMILLKVIL